MFNRVCSLIWLLIFSIVFGVENFEIQSKTDKNYTLKFKSNEIAFEEHGDYIRLVDKKNVGKTSELGMPELSQFSTFFQMEPGIEYSVNFNIKKSSIVENIKVFPVQNENYIKGETVIEHNYDDHNYSTAFPEKNLVKSDVMTSRGMELFSITFIPFKYDIQNEILEIIEEVEIQINEFGTRSHISNNNFKKSYILEPLYANLIINYTYSDDASDYQHPAIMYICGGNSCDNTYLQQLLDWRHKQGYIVYAIPESESGSNLDNIRDYLQEAYYNWENPPEIVTLVGDTDGGYGLPYEQHSWNGDNGASDFEYSQLDGNDLIPEVAIGRMSAYNSSQLQVIANKTLLYEKAQDFYGNEIEDGWFERVALVGDPSTSGYSTIFTNQAIEAMMEEYGVTDIRTNYGNGGYSNWVENQFEDGLLYYNYRGWYGASGIDDDGYDNGFMSTFVTVLTCGTGDYNYNNPSYIEKWIRDGSLTQGGGAVGAVGVASISTHTAYNNIVNLGIYDGIFANQVNYAGSAVVSGRLALLNTYPGGASGATETFIKWTNLMGDAALHLWTDTPKRFNIEFDSNISSGTNFYEVTVLNSETNEPIKGARVTLLRGNDDIFTSKLSDEYGNVTFNWDSPNSGDIDLTVIKNNYRPFESVISVSSQASLSINENNIEINDSGDGILNPGETASIEIPISCTGSSINGLDYIVASSSNYLTVNNVSSSHDNISQGETIYLSVDVSLSSEAIDSDNIYILMDIENNSNQLWQLLYSLDIESASVIINSYSTNTNANIINPGDNIDLTLSVTNTGQLNIEDVNFTINSFENLLIPLNSSINVNQINSQQTIDVSGITFHVNENMYPGIDIPVNIDVYSETGYSRTETVIISLGRKNSDDPSGPDNYGYYIFDSTDSRYDLAPNYNWIEIANSSSGGYELDDLYDNGNGNSLSTTTDIVSLGFNFIFYGETYNEITVSTNGWISFGRNEMGSFRNYPVPGPGGPSPMIAVFWDDLKTTSGGEVWVRKSNQDVIIQWDQMRTYQNNSTETFQLILYNKEYASSETITGDSEAKIQYKYFDNDSDGNYNSYTPLHGGYCSVGIENHLGNDGVPYTFNNEYQNVLGQAALSNGDALFITTGYGIESDSEIGGCTDQNSCNFNENATFDNGSCEYPDPGYDCDGNIVALLGDLNNDAEINILDIVSLVNIVIQEDDYNEIGDLNYDSVIDILDIVLLLNIIIGQ